MSNREIELLLFIKNNPDIPWADVLNAFDPATKINETNAILKKFLKENLIAISPYCHNQPPHGRIRISPNGVVVLLAEQEKQREADKPSTFDKNDHEVKKKLFDFNKTEKIIALIIGIGTLIVAILELIT